MTNNNNSFNYVFIKNFSCNVYTVLFMTLMVQLAYAVLIIATVPPVVTFLGHVAVLNCPLDGMDPVKEIHWRTPSGDKLTVSNDRYELRGNALYIDETDQSFAGVYQCVTVDTANHIFKADIQLVVQSCADANLCLNGGTCVTILGLASTKDHIRCECRAGFTGDKCQEELVTMNVLAIFCGIMAFIVASLITCCYLYRSHRKHLNKQVSSLPPKLVPRPETIGADQLLGRVLDAQRAGLINTPGRPSGAAVSKTPGSARASLADHNTDGLLRPSLDQLRNIHLSSTSPASQPDEVGLLQPSVNEMRSLEAASAGLISSQDPHSVTPSASKILSTDITTDNVVTSSPGYGATTSPTNAMTEGGGRKTSQSTGSRRDSSDGGYNSSATTDDERTPRSNSLVGRHKPDSSRASSRGRMASSSEEERSTSYVAGSGRQFPLIHRRGASSRRSGSRTPYDSVTDHVSNASKDTLGRDGVYSSVPSAMSPSSRSLYSDNFHLDASPSPVSRRGDLLGAGDAVSPSNNHQTADLLVSGCSGRGSDENCDPVTWDAIFRMRGEMPTQQVRSASSPTWNSAAAAKVQDVVQHNLKSPEQVSPRRLNTAAVPITLIHADDGLVPGSTRNVSPERQDHQRLFEDFFRSDAATQVNPQSQWTPVDPQAHWTPVNPQSQWTPVDPQAHWTPVNPQSQWTPVNPQSHWTLVDPQAHWTPVNPQAHLTPMDESRFKKRLDGVNDGGKIFPSDAATPVNLQSHWTPMDESRSEHKLERVDNGGKKETIYHVGPRPSWAGVASPLDLPLQPSASHFGYRGESIQLRESAGLVPDIKTTDKLAATDMSFQPSISKVKTNQNDWTHDLFNGINHVQPSTSNWPHRAVEASNQQDEKISDNVMRELQGVSPLINTSHLIGQDSRHDGATDNRDNVSHLLPSDRQSAVISPSFSRDLTSKEVSAPRLELNESVHHRSNDQVLRLARRMTQSKPRYVSPATSTLLQARYQRRDLQPEVSSFVKRFADTTHAIYIHPELSTASTFDLPLIPSDAGSTNRASGTMASKSARRQLSSAGIKRRGVEVPVSETTKAQTAVVADKVPVSETTKVQTAVVADKQHAIQDFFLHPSLTRVPSRVLGVVPRGSDSSDSDETTTTTTVVTEENITNIVDQSKSHSNQRSVVTAAGASASSAAVRGSAADQRRQSSVKMAQHTTVEDIAQKDQRLKPSVERLAASSPSLGRKSLRRRDSFADNRTSNASGRDWRMSDETVNGSVKEAVDFSTPAGRSYPTTLVHSQSDVGPAIRSDRGATRMALKSTSVDEASSNVTANASAVERRKNTNNKESSVTWSGTELHVVNRHATSSGQRPSLYPSLYPHNALDSSPPRWLTESTMQPEQVGHRRVQQISSTLGSLSDASVVDDWKTLTDQPDNRQPSFNSAFHVENLIDLDPMTSDDVRMSHSFDVNLTSNNTGRWKDASLNPSHSFTGLGRPDDAVSQSGVPYGRVRDQSLSPSQYPVTNGQALTDDEAAQALSQHSLQHPPLRYERSIPGLEHVPLITDISKTLTNSVSSRSASYSDVRRPEVDLRVTSTSARNPSSPSVLTSVHDMNMSAHPDRRRSTFDSSRHDVRSSLTAVNNTIRNSRSTDLQSDNVEHNSSSVSSLQPATSSLWMDITEHVKSSYPFYTVTPEQKPGSTNTVETTSGKRFVERSAHGKVKLVTFSDERSSTAAIITGVPPRKTSSIIKSRNNSTSNCSQQYHSSGQHEDELSQLNEVVTNSELANNRSSTDHLDSIRSLEDKTDEEILSRLRTEAENFRNQQAMSKSHNTASPGDHSPRSYEDVVAMSDVGITMPSQSNLNQSAQDAVLVPSRPRARDSSSPGSGYVRDSSPPRSGKARSSIQPDSELNNLSFRFNALSSGELSRRETPSNLELSGSTFEGIGSGNGTLTTLIGGQNVAHSSSRRETPLDTQYSANTWDLQAPSRSQLSGSTFEETAYGHRVVGSNHDRLSPSVHRFTTSPGHQWNDDRVPVYPPGHQRNDDRVPVTNKHYMNDNANQHSRTQSQLSRSLTPSCDGETFNRYMSRDDHGQVGVAPSETEVLEAAWWRARSDTNDDVANARLSSMSLHEDQNDDRLISISGTSLKHEIPHCGVHLSGTSDVSHPSMAILLGQCGHRDDHSKPSSTNVNQSSRAARGAAAEPSQTRVAAEQQRTLNDVINPSNTDLLDDKSRSSIRDSRRLRPSALRMMSSLADSINLAVNERMAPSRTRLPSERLKTSGQLDHMAPSRTALPSERLETSGQLDHVTPSVAYFDDRSSLKMDERSNVKPSVVRIHDGDSTTSGRSDYVKPSVTEVVDKAVSDRGVEPSRTALHSTLESDVSTRPSVRRMLNEQATSHGNKLAIKPSAVIQTDDGDFPTARASFQTNKPSSHVLRGENLQVAAVERRRAIQHPSSTQFTDDVTLLPPGRNSTTPREAARPSTTSNHLNQTSHNRNVKPSLSWVAMDETTSGGVRRPSLTHMDDGELASRYEVVVATPSDVLQHHDEDKSDKRSQPSFFSLLFDGSSPPPSSAAHKPSSVDLSDNVGQQVYRDVTQPSRTIVDQGVAVGHSATASGRVGLRASSTMMSPRDGATATLLSQHSDPVAPSRGVSVFVAPSLGRHSDTVAPSRGASASTTMMSPRDDATATLLGRHSDPVAPSRGRSVNDNDNAASRNDFAFHQSMTSLTSFSRTRDPVCRPSSHSPFEADHSGSAVALSGTMLRPSVLDVVDDSRRASLHSSRVSGHSDDVGQIPSLHPITVRSDDCETKRPSATDIRTITPARHTDLEDHREERVNRSSCIGDLPLGTSRDNLNQSAGLYDSCRSRPSTVTLASTSGAIAGRRVSGTMKPSSADVPGYGTSDQSAVRPSSFAINRGRDCLETRLGRASSDPSLVAGCSNARMDQPVNNHVINSINPPFSTLPDCATTTDVVTRTGSNSSSLLTTRSGYRLCTPAEAASSRQEMMSRDRGSTVRAAVEAIEERRGPVPWRTQSEERSIDFRRTSTDDRDSCYWNSFIDVCDTPPRSSTSCCLRSCTVTNDDVTDDVTVNCMSPYRSPPNRFQHYRTPPMSCSLVEPQICSTVSPPSEQRQVLHRHSRSLRSLPSSRSSLHQPPYQRY